MFRALYPVYKYLNLLSVDVALGAVCCALFFARLLKVSVLPFGLMSLGLTVWIIYTVDHLLDARQMKKKASTARHQFHQEYFSRLMVVVIIASLVNAVLIFFIRRPVFWGGVLLVICVGAYLLIHRFLKFPKEIFIAILYTLGVLLPSASVTALPAQQWPWVIVIQFMFTALLNLLIFSWFDAAKDTRDGTRSFVTMVHAKNSRVIIWTIIIINILVGLFFFNGPPTCIIIAMNVVLAAIFAFEKKFVRNEYFRLLGDGVFFLPIIYMWL